MKFTEKDRDLFIQIFIAFSQVTFGILWASIFLPLDQYKISVILLNAVTTTLFVSGAWYLNRRQ